MVKCLVFSYVIVWDGVIINVDIYPGLTSTPVPIRSATDNGSWTLILKGRTGL